MKVNSTFRLEITCTCTSTCTSTRAQARLMDVGWHYLCDWKIVQMRHGPLHSLGIEEETHSICCPHSHAPHATECSILCTSPPAFLPFPITLQIQEISALYQRTDILFIPSILCSISSPIWHSFWVTHCRHTTPILIILTLSFTIGIGWRAWQCEHFFLISHWKIIRKQS